MSPKSSNNEHTTELLWHKDRHLQEIPISDSQIEALSAEISESLEKLEEKFEEFVTPRAFKSIYGRA